MKETDETKSEELLKSFDSFVEKTIVYIKSYFDSDVDFYEKLSYFNGQSLDLLTWRNVIEVADGIHIPDLNKDELYSEFCDIKSLYDYVKKKDVKLVDQVKSYIMNKTNCSIATNIDPQSIECDDNEQVESTLTHGDENSVRSDHLWAYLLNINPNKTPNFKNLICYIVSIPCSNSYVETIFSHMKHVWSDYRNRMEIDLVSAELKIRMNGNYSCPKFYHHILSEKTLLKEIRKNAKYD